MQEARFDRSEEDLHEQRRIRRQVEGNARTGQSVVGKLTDDELKKAEQEFDQRLREAKAEYMKNEWVLPASVGGLLPESAD